MKSYISLFIIFIFSATAGCGAKVESKATTSKTWYLFAARDYEEALNYFVDLIPSQGSPAIVGAGWCEIRLGHLSDAEAYFAQASPSDPDGLAGWSLASWGNDNVEVAITKANAVLQINAQYVFPRDHRVDYKDLIWIQAASYFQLHDYAECISKIGLLDPNFSADPNSAGIDHVLLIKLQSLGAAHE